MEVETLMEIPVINTEALKTKIVYLSHAHIAQASRRQKVARPRVEIYCEMITDVTGVGETDAEANMVVDNTTLVPVFHPDGTPFMKDNIVILGYQVKDVLDEEGNPTGETEYDLTMPITENQPYHYHIGEYDKVIWECFKKANPNSVAIETILEEGILRRLGVPGYDLKFIATEAWLNTQTT